jgi:hypothetical protein
MRAIELFCDECGNRMEIDYNGISHHLTENNNVDHNQDAAHVSYNQENGGGEE